MTWTQTLPQDFEHGMTADEHWATLNERHAHLYAYYQSPAFFAMNYNLSVADTTMRDYAVLWIPKNLDNTPIKVYVRASIDDGSGGSAANKGLVKLIETTTSTGDAADVASGTDDCTELGDPFSTIDLTPTGTADGREFKLQAKCIDAGDVMTIHSVFGFYNGTGSVTTTGLGASGFRTTNATSVYGAAYPISTELVASLTNGPRKIAVDRPVCVFSYFTDYYRTARLNSTSLTWETVDRGFIPIPDYAHPARTYKVYVNMTETGGATPHCALMVPGVDDDLHFSGTGWSSATFSTSALSGAGATFLPYEIKMKRVGGTRALLQTVQIFRHS